VQFGSKQPADGLLQGGGFVVITAGFEQRVHAQGRHPAVSRIGFVIFVQAASRFGVEARQDVLPGPRDGVGGRNRFPFGCVAQYETNEKDKSNKTTERLY
jgi:hypothetical protein